MAAGRMENNDRNEDDSDAKLQIQVMIEDLEEERVNLMEPGNETLDAKIDTLDRIFTQSVDIHGEGDDGSSKSVDVSQARLDIVAFSLLASINHQRIRRVAASTWTFRAADFANRIVRLMNVDEGSQCESLTDNTKLKLSQMVSCAFNQCTPLRPLLGAIVLTNLEAAPKEKRQRQPKSKEQLVAVQLQPKKVTEINEEDQHAKVTKRVEYIYKIVKKKWEEGGRKPICFYRFILDPTSFSNTVENIFYVSFLVKDGFVALNEGGHDELPSLELVGRPHDETQAPASSAKKQTIISFDEKTWKAMVQCFGLKEAAIDQNARSHHSQKRPRQE